MAEVPINVLLRDNARARPEGPAITIGGQTLSRADLHMWASKLATDFEQLGIGEGSWVTLLLENSAEFFAACCACWQLGAIPQPQSRLLEPEVQTKLLRLTGADLVIGGDNVGNGAALPVKYRPVGPERPFDDRMSPRWKAIASCGTTAAPHIVVAGSRGEWDLERRPLQMEHDEVQLVTGPLFHDAHFGPAMFGLFFGHHLIVLPEFDAHEALTAIAAHRVTFMVTVPSMLLAMHRLLESDPNRYDMTSLRALWHIGAPCPAWLKRWWIERLGPDRVSEFFGIAEAQAATTITGGEWLQRPGSVGRPLFGEVRVIGSAGEDAAPGTVGEVYMRRGQGIPNPHRYIGYEHEKVLADDWQSFGDLGSVDADGYLWICGRQADVIRRSGGDVFPQRIEEVLLGHPAVLSCGVVGLKRTGQDDAIHAVVQAARGASKTELQQFLDSRLSHELVPATFRFVTEPVHNVCDKIDRQTLARREAALLAELPST